MNSKLLCLAGVTGAVLLQAGPAAARRNGNCVGSGGAYRADDVERVTSTGESCR
jgi:hypothetical protein